MLLKSKGFLEKKKRKFISNVLNIKLIKHQIEILFMFLYNVKIDKALNIYLFKMNEKERNQNLIVI